MSSHIRTRQQRRPVANLMFVTSTHLLMAQPKLPMQTTNMGNAIIGHIESMSKKRKQQCFEHIYQAAKMQSELSVIMPSSQRQANTTSEAELANNYDAQTYCFTLSTTENSVVEHTPEINVIDKAMSTIQ